MSALSRAYRRGGDNRAATIAAWLRTLVDWNISLERAADMIEAGVPWGDSEQIQFENLACFSIKGEQAALNEAPCGMVRFSRPLTNDEWKAFAETCAAFAGRFGPCQHKRGLIAEDAGMKCVACEKIVA